MAQQRKIKVNLEEFEETQQRKNAATQERNDAAMQPDDYTKAEECSNAGTQERRNAAMQPKDNVKMEDYGDVATQERSDAVTQPADNTNEEECSNAVTQERNDAETKRRKKSIPRTNGQTYYIESRHKKALKMINACNDIDMQDVVRTALDIFLSKYMKEDGQGIIEEGIAEVNKYIWEE